MKKTLVILFLAMMTILPQSAKAEIYCCCYGGGFYEGDLEQRITDFMQAKRNVSQEDIISLNELEYKYYVPNVYKAIGELFLLGIPKEERQALRKCERECLSLDFQKSVYEVTYLKGYQQCTQRLYLHAKRNPFTGTVKTIVKKKEHPICN